MKKLTAVLVLLLLSVVAVVVSINTYLPVSDPLKKADVVVAISGGDTIGRAEHAVKLYKQHYAPVLVFSGAAKDPKSPSNALVMKNWALKRGVPSEAIIIEETARNTEENAKQIKKLTPNHKSIILVTSKYHQRRAFKEFRDIFGADVNIINSPANDKNWNPNTWWLTPYGWWVSVTETIKLVF